MPRRRSTLRYFLAVSFRSTVRPLFVTVGHPAIPSETLSPKVGQWFAEYILPNLSPTGTQPHEKSPLRNLCTGCAIIAQVTDNELVAIKNM